MDIEARQLALTQLNRAKQGDSKARESLKLAREANAEFAANRSSAALGRRSVLAQEAYKARQNAEVGRVRAAYALLAAREGAAALTAQQTIAQVTNAQQREVLVTQSKNAQLRRNIMLQASHAAEKAFDAAPPLPGTIGGAERSGGQVTVGLTENYRPPSYVKHAGSFFPLDVRAAAGALRGLGEAPSSWCEGTEAAIDAGAQAVADRANELATAVTQQEPGAANMSVQAQGLVAQLRSQHGRESVNGIPWLHIAIGLAVGGVLMHYAKKKG